MLVELLSKIQKMRFFLEKCIARLSEKNDCLEFCNRKKEIKMHLPMQHIVANID